MDEYAFPRPRSINPRDGHLEDAGSGGMTLRDYFAAKAIAPQVSQAGGISISPYLFAREAGVAYAIADAMLKAREA